MTAPHLRAALWLALALGVAIACAAQFAGSGGARLQTNLLALLPPTERNPVAEYAAGKLAEAAGNRAVFLVGERAGVDAAAAARLLAAELRRSNGFRSVLADLPAVDLGRLAGFYLTYRFNLLSEADQRALSSGSAVLEQRLERKLLAPFRFGLGYPAAEDPFGLADAWLASLPLASLRLEPDNGVLVARGDERTWVLVAAEPAGSSYDGDSQQRVAKAVAAAEQALRAAHPDARLLRSGTVFYADAARASAEREVDFIGAGSLAGMLLLLYLVFRSIRPLVLGLLTVAFGVTAAATVTAGVHGELHLITLVFGASLIGEAIDYAVQYFAAHLGAGADWDAEAGLRRIAPGLTIALATSLLGYSALMLAPFPALSQIALFALVGLSAAWLSVFLLLPALLARPGKRDPEKAVALPRRFLLWWQATVRPRHCFSVGGLLLLAALPGWLQLRSNDDVRLLVARPPTLVAQEEKIRELTGIGGSSQFFLVEGASPDEVLANEERLSQRLAVLVTSGELASFQATSTFVPSSQRQQENRALWREKVFSDEAALRTLFAKTGLRDDLADRQLAAFKAAENRRLTVQAWLAAPLSAPYRHLWLGAQASGYAAIVLPRGMRDLRGLADSARNLAGVTLVDKPGSVSSLFRSYREWGASWLAGALCLVYGMLCLRYGWRLGAVVLMPTILAVALALGVFGYSGTPVTLFNIMGLMLVIGVGVNYAIFLREGGVRTAATLAGVLLSAGTTLLSFGLLAFSSMPALSGFGLTLLVGIGIAVLLAPMVLSFGSLPRA